MKAMMKSIVLEKFNSRTSRGWDLLEASSKRGRRRESIIVLEIWWNSGDD